MKAVIEKLLFGVVIMMSVVSPALAGGAAQAHYHYQYRHHHYYNYSEALPRYESCNCWFGYDGNGPGKCTPVTACSSEGGRCRASCPPQTGYRKPTSPVKVVVPANDLPANDHPANDHPANDH